jgi:transmembrane sensor
MNRDKFIALLSKRFSGELSTEEQNLLEQAIANNAAYALLADEFDQYVGHNPAHTPSATQLKRTWDLIDAAENEGFREKFNYTSTQRKSYFKSPMFRVAAMLVLFIGASLCGYFLVSTDDHDLITIAAADQKTFKLLDDGTKIWLNKNSAISYNENFGKSKREIFLEGEAYFDVIKRKTVPLIIHARNVDIEVKGTAFNVNAYKENDQIQVALVRGLIQVTDQLDSRHKVLLKPNEKLIVSAHATADLANFTVVTLDSKKMLSNTKWIADTLVFRKEKLKDLVVRMERKYDLKIEVRSEQLKEKKFSGTFTTETIHQALEALKLSYPLTFTINNRLVVIKD